jgi:hypothetical protein
LIRDFTQSITKNASLHSGAFLLPRYSRALHSSVIPAVVSGNPYRAEIGCPTETLGHDGAVLRNKIQAAAS